jgi:hypothetical protein
MSCRKLFMISIENANTAIWSRSCRARHYCVLPGCETGSCAIIDFKPTRAFLPVLFLCDNFTASRQPIHNIRTTSFVYNRS